MYQKYVAYKRNHILSDLEKRTFTINYI